MTCRSSSTRTSARAPRSPPGAVDAATGFANNEPVQLELAGTPTTVLHVDDITPLPGPGADRRHGDARDQARRRSKAFVAVDAAAMQEIQADPNVGLDAAIKAVPELASARPTQAAILDATIKSWTGPVQEADGLGAHRRGRLGDVDHYLTTLGLVPNAVTVQESSRRGTFRA